MGADQSLRKTHPCVVGEGWHDRDARREGPLNRGRGEHNRMQADVEGGLEYVQGVLPMVPTVATDRRVGKDKRGPPALRRWRRH